MHQVGAYQNGTILTGECSAEIVVIFKTLPQKGISELLAKKVEEEYQNVSQAEPSVPMPLNFEINDTEFKVFNSSVCTRVLITTLRDNFARLSHETHLDAKQMHRNMEAVHFGGLLESKTKHLQEKRILIRIMRDIVNRCEGLRPLNMYMINIVACYREAQTSESNRYRFR